MQSHTNISNPIRQRINKALLDQPTIQQFLSLGEQAQRSRAELKKKREAANAKAKETAGDKAGEGSGDKQGVVKS